MAGHDTGEGIALAGSVETVVDYFSHAVSSVLYQRGVYPAESFERTTSHGLALMRASEATLCRYLEQVLSQVRAWLTTGQARRLVLVVNGVDSGNTLERWVFLVEAAGDKENAAAGAAAAPKSQKEIAKEVQAIIRQITSSVTFLPLLDEPCTFDLLVYADSNGLTVPGSWEDSNPCAIGDASEVQLRSLATNEHRVETLVAYRNQEFGA